MCEHLRRCPTRASAVWVGSSASAVPDEARPECRLRGYSDELANPWQAGGHYHFHRERLRDLITVPELGRSRGGLPVFGGLWRDRVAFRTHAR